MVSLNLKDIYLHVPIHPSHWRYLWFALRNSEGVLTVYQWKGISFGLASAPRVFTKLLAPVTAHLHLQRCLMYSAHRRHLPYSGVSTPGGSDTWHQSPLSFHLRVCHQPGEVSLCPVSDHAPLRSTHQHGWGRVCPPRTGCKIVFIRPWSFARFPWCQLDAFMK